MSSNVKWVGIEKCWHLLDYEGDIAPTDAFSALGKYKDQSYICHYLDVSIGVHLLVISSWCADLCLYLLSGELFFFGSGVIVKKGFSLWDDQEPGLKTEGFFRMFSAVFAHLVINHPCGEARWCQISCCGYVFHLQVLKDEPRSQERARLQRDHWRKLDPKRTRTSIWGEVSPRTRPWVNIGTQPKEAEESRQGVSGCLLQQTSLEWSEAAAVTLQISLTWELNGSSTNIWSSLKSDPQEDLWR